MASERLSHHVLRIKNAETTVAFYKEQFGMILKEKIVKGNDTHYLLGFDALPNSTLLELHYRREFDELDYRHSRHDGYWKIGVTLQDVDRARERLVRSGNPVSEPNQFYDIGYLCHLSDPTGYCIELLQHDFRENFQKLPAEPHPLGSSPTLGQITLRIKDPRASLAFYVDGLGMKLLSRQTVEAHRFTLYFLAFTTEDPPDSDVDAVVNREWLWKRPYTTLELQHLWDIDQSFKYSYCKDTDRSLGFQGICVSSRNLSNLIDKLRNTGIHVNQDSNHSSPEDCRVVDPDGCRIRLTQELSRATR